MRAIQSCLLLSLVSGCVLATDAGDRQVDRRIGRDLQFNFVDMIAHAGTPLDVALVQRRRQGTEPALPLRTHARIVLPQSKPGQPYPDELLELANVLPEPPVETRLLFYADNNNDNAIQSVLAAGAEHIWDVAVPATGVGEFRHSIDFVNFTEDDYNAQGDVILKIDSPADWRPQACENGFEHTIEVRVYVSPQREKRESGYYKNFASNEPSPSSIVLEDIVDGGNEYLIETLIDGSVVRSKLLTAPATGDFVINQADWHPTVPEATTARRCE